MNKTARERVFHTVEEACAHIRENNEGCKIVFTNGCFDILHIGHLRALEEAKRYGDLLIVGVNSDDSVKRLKGMNRPVIPELERAEILAGLWCVDYTFIFHEENALKSIQTLLPGVYIKSADYDLTSTPEGEFAINHGIEIHNTNYYKGHSTSDVIGKINK